jgi:two-component system, OmpR family, sensor histidine kinase BaeS
VLSKFSAKTWDGDVVVMAHGPERLGPVMSGVATRSAPTLDCLKAMRILHQLFLLLAAAVLLAVVLVSAAVAWNLRAGFADYLHARDKSELRRLAQRVEALYADDPQLQTLRTSRPAMRQLIDSLLPSPALRPAGWVNGLPSTSAPPPSAPPPSAPPNRPAPPGFGAGPGDVLPPPAPGPSSHLLQRAAIVDLQGQHLAGPPLMNPQDPLRWPISIGGEVVAFAASARAPELASADAQFLRHQYLQLALAAGATLLAAGGAAWWAARRWSRPLEGLKQAAQRIAQGDYSALPAGGGQGRPGASPSTSNTLEIAQLQAAVGAMAVSLQNMDSSRRRWLAQISHELRTPLTVLRGELEAIQDGARRPTPEVLASLRDEAEHISHLVTDLHTLAVADLNGMPCSFDWGDAGALLTQNVQRFAALADRAALTLQLQSAPPATVYWDFERLSQVLAALLDNGLRYTRAPGQLTVLARSDEHLKRYVIEVNDSAPGVALAELPQLFDPLFRASAAPQRGGRPGSGMGLAIAKSIVMAHGGQIHASPSALGGMRIVLDLPWEAA